MVKLEIRNLESSKSHLIDPGGVVLGREGGDAQIKLADQGVSKKHARIYAKRGTWYLEDLDSANGTYLEDERITGPVVLTAGSVFTMSRQQFEVVQIVTEEPEPTRNPRDANPRDNGDDMDHAETNAMEPGDLPDRLRQAKGGNKRPQGKSNADLRGRNRGVDDDEPPATDSNARGGRDDDDRGGGGRGGRSKGASDGGGRAQVQSASRARPEDADVPAPSFAYFATAIPRAIAYYMKSVPLMAVNPLGTIRKGIAEQPLPALSNVELIAYAFPALLFSALVGAVCTAILAIVSRTFSIMMLFPIVPLISSAVGAVISGLICHPFLTWVVDKLEGQSDARSRSNMFVMQMTASALLALPSGLAVLLSIVRVPFIGILPLLISVVASLVTVYLLFSWFRYFGVVQWFEYVILGLGALLVLNAAYGLVMTTINSISSGGYSGPAVAGAGGVPTIEPVPGESPEMTAARQKAAELAASGDAAGAAKVMQEAAEKAARAAGSATAANGTSPSNPGSSESAPPPTSPGSSATGAVTASATAPPASPNGTAAASDPPPSTPPPPVAAASPPPGGEVKLPKGKPSYPDYWAMRTQVLKTVEEDPTVLRRAEVLTAYRGLITATKTAQDKFRSTEKGVSAPEVNARLREVEVYDASWRQVLELNKLLNR